MDSQLAAVLTNRGTASLNRSHLPERTGKSMEMPPLTDIQDVPIDLSLKSSCSLPLDSQPLCYKMAPSCNYKAKQFYWRETRIQGRMEETSKDSTDTIEIVAEVTGVHKPVLSNIDSLPNSCKNSLTPGFTGCLLEQKGVTSESLSSDQSESHTASLVTVKDEIEEVCIGELEGYSDDQSDSQGSLNEGLTRDIADGTDMQNTIVSGANSNMVPMDTITALNTEPEDIAADSCGFTAREASPSEGQSPGLNGDVSSLLGVEMQVNKQPKFNLGILSDGGEIPIKGGDAEGEEKEMVRWKGRKKCSSRHAPAYSIRTRSQRRREMNREAKAECGKEDNTLLGKETQKREVLLQSSPPASDLPGRFQGLCETEGEQDAGADADRIGKARECQQKLQEEVLDLSLSRKGGRSNTVCRKGGFEEGIETSLLMEVDEIVQQEVAEDEEDAEIGSRERQAAIGFDLPNGEAPFSSSSAPPSPSASPSVDPSLADLLLIDNQGVPYTLTPDGQKVFQVELPKPHKAFSVRPRPKSKQVKPKDSTVSAALSNQVLPNALPCQPSGATPSCLIPPASPGSSDDSKTASSSGAKSSSLAAPQPPTLLDLEPQSQPIRILANSATTSPILLLPSSQLSSLSPSKPNTNSGLMALSLPVSLTQNSTSTPLLLVISPLPTGSAPSTSSPILAVPSSVSLSQTTSPSAVSLPLYSVQTNLESSFPTNPAVPVLNPESFTLFPATSGNSNQCTPSSPSVSSSTGGPIPDLSSKEIIPKLSPNRLMKSDPASDTKSSSITETQIECAQSPILASLSPKEIPPYQIRHSLKTSPPSASANPFSADDQSYPISGTPPPETIFPTNHPKNLNLSPNCPRRILYCQFCPRAFYYLSDLERHSITHSQSKPHVCSLCSKAFKRSSHLERHKHIHTGQRNFICPICSKRFREAGELLRHQRVHTGEKPFQCLQCHMRFAERNTLRRHAKRKHQEQQGPDGQEEGGRYSDDIQEDSAEWYSSTVPELDSDNETD